MDLRDALNDLMTELQAEAASKFAAADRRKDEAFGLTSERLRGRGEGIDRVNEKLRKLLAAEPEPPVADGRHAPDGRGYACAVDGDTWPCVEVKRIAADLAGFPQIEPEPEPHEVTLEWTEPEPASVEWATSSARRAAECRALAEHLQSKQHYAQIDVPFDDWEALMRLHNGLPHGRGRGKDHTADHGHVTARAAELYRERFYADRERQQKAVTTR